MSKFVGALSTSGLFERTIYLIRLLFYFQIAVWIVEGFHHQFDFSNLIWKIIIAALVQRTYQKTLKNLQYSFWTFSSLIFVYLFDEFTNHLFEYDSVLTTCYFILLAILCVIFYIISSPLFYPRVRWWEYDFRYQGDLKVKIYPTPDNDQLFYEARLTDLRRGAGCLVLFQEIEMGKEFQMQIFDPVFAKMLKIKFMSKRSVGPGRGYVYGIKFVIIGHEEKIAFKELKNFWLSFKQARLQKKFENLDGQAASRQDQLT